MGKIEETKLDYSGMKIQSFLKPFLAFCPFQYSLTPTLKDKEAKGDKRKFFAFRCY